MQIMQIWYAQNGIVDLWCFKWLTAATSLRLVWIFKNKIHPGESFDKDLYELPPEEVKAIPTVCGSLREAMESLDKDREFLTQGGVFTDDQIDAYIALKFEEIHKFEHAPHPVEFEMYYSS